MNSVEEAMETPPLQLLDLAPTAVDLHRAVRDGLAGCPKTLPCRFLYDQRGAWLFDRICGLEAYYPTRTELGILQANMGEIIRLLGPGIRLVEFGSGGGAKSRLLLRHLRDAAEYVPVDISREQLIEHATSVAGEYPAIRVTPVCADYHDRLLLPETETSPSETAVQKTVVFFPGSTIGNFEPAEAVDFLRRIAFLCGPGGNLLVGVDLQKNPERIEAAYNDAEGVTAAFNLNILERINRECGATFDLSSFEHRAIYDEQHSRIEMHLVSLQEQEVWIPGTTTVNATSVAFAAGEAIVTEHSYKYTIAGFTLLAGQAGLVSQHVWIDPDRLFSVHLLRTGSGHTAH